MLDAILLENSVRGIRCEADIGSEMPNTGGVVENV